ncbi:MAG: hypothetical protein K2X91_03405, partial [Thermoleophilia bacterium]|nr:hypothetical protein [Thermoleophilia bacterium]
ADLLAKALLLVAEASRLDGKAPFGPPELNDLAERLTRASSAFGLDQIVARALEQRAGALGLRQGTADLLLLFAGDGVPLELLPLDDDAFKARVAEAEAELGDVD